MNRNFLNYTEWQSTADTLHMYLQMAGKVKLECCDKRPEWAHIRLYITANGLTTGLVGGKDSSFEITFDLRDHCVIFRNTRGRSVVYPLFDGLSVAEFYRQLTSALEFIGSPTTINVRPQEFYDPVDFNIDEKHHSYDREAVTLFLDNLHFAYAAIKCFLAPFRGKVHYPAYYFGTMDLSSIVYSGEPVPFGTDSAISSHAFDERCCEFGFWPGDINAAKPSFYILPYPFISDIKGNDKMIQPDKAVFTPEKNEFFLTLEDAFSYDNPKDAVIKFLNSGFQVIQKIKKWENLDWITYPLQYDNTTGD